MPRTSGLQAPIMELTGESDRQGASKRYCVDINQVIREKSLQHALTLQGST